MSVRARAVCSRHQHRQPQTFVWLQLRPGGGVFSKARPWFMSKTEVRPFWAGSEYLGDFVKQGVAFVPSSERSALLWTTVLALSAL